MYCTNCGASIGPGERFCRACGAPAGAEAPAARGVESWYVRPEEPPVPDRAAAPFGMVPAPAEDPRIPVMRRAFNLCALATLIVYAVQSVILSGAASAAVMAWLLPRLGSVSDPDDVLGVVEQLLQKLDDPAEVLPIAAGYAIVYVLALLLGILVSGLLRRKLKPCPIERRSLSLGRFASTALIVFGFWGVGAVLGNWAEMIVPGGQSDTLSSSVPVMLLTVFAAPVLEELVFRKFLIDRLLPFGERTAVVFTALLFGMAHQNAMQFFLAFLVGLVFAVVYIRTGNILYTMLLHFMINLFATLDAVGVMVFGDGFDTVWLIAALALTLAGIVTAVLKRRDPFFATVPNYIPGANRAAYRCWGMVLCRVIVILSIIGYAVIFAVGARNFPLSLLHFVPAACAVAVILAVSARSAAKTAGGPAFQNVTES